MGGKDTGCRTNISVMNPKEYKNKVESLECMADDDTDANDTDVEAKAPESPAVSEGLKAYGSIIAVLLAFGAVLAITSIITSYFTPVNAAVAFEILLTGFVTYELIMLGIRMLGYGSYSAGMLSEEKYKSLKQLLH